VSERIEREEFGTAATGIGALLGRLGIVSDAEQESEDPVADRYADAPHLTAEEIAGTATSESQMVRRREEILSGCGLRARQLEASFATFEAHSDGQRAALVECKRFVAAWPRVRAGLVLVGPTGRGKTHLAAATLRGAIESEVARLQGGWAHRALALDAGSALQRRFVWLRVPEFVNEYRERRFESGNALRERARSADLLVLDELAGEGAQDLGLGLLFDVLGFRYEDQRPTLVTTNKTGAELEGIYDSRVVSRFLDPTAYATVKMDGLDYRLEMAKASKQRKPS